MKNGLSSECRECKKARARQSSAELYASSELNDEKRRQRKRDLRLVYVYGITREELDKQIELQESKCYLCGVKPDKLHIDHCHVTNKVRGLLCGNCNRGLGMFMDNVAVMEKAIAYIQTNGVWISPC